MIIPMEQTLHGVVPILKEAGMTSHDVVAKVRKILGTKKIGHSGTLDPAVRGVLPLMVGNATRLSDYFMNAPKMYRCVLRLGWSTDTQDATGELLESCSLHLLQSLEYQRPALDVLMEKTLEDFVGEIVQIPPDYSSVKIGGKKLVDLARKGKRVEKKPERKVTIYGIKIRSVRDLKEAEYPEVEFDVTCSKGTYVRTICHDIGEILGTKAHMKSLVRLESGGFALEDALPIEELRVTSVISLSDSAWRLAKTMPYVKLQLNEQARTQMLNGIKFDLRSYSVEDSQCLSESTREDVLVFAQREFVGIARENLSSGDLELAKLMNRDF